MLKFKVFDIFWNILNTMKENLCHECVKEGLLSPYGKFEKIFLDFPGKITVFYSFDPTFLPVPP